MANNNEIVSRSEIKQAAMSMALACKRVKRMEGKAVQGEWIKHSW